jgi:hypothetical protein
VIWFRLRRMTGESLGHVEVASGISANQHRNGCRPLGYTATP